MKKEVYQLFIGKVATEIGYDRTMKLLKESKEAFDVKPEKESKKITTNELNNK